MFCTWTPMHRRVGSAVCTHMHVCMCIRVLLCSYACMWGLCYVYVCICILLCKHVYIWALLCPCMCVHVCCNPVVCTCMYARTGYVCIMYVCVGVAASAQVPPSSRIAHPSPTPSCGTSTQIPAVLGTPQE